MDRTNEGTDLPFRELVDAAPDGVVVCDESGVIVLANAEATRMFGYATDELLGQRIELLVPDRARGQHGAHLAGYTSAPRLRPMGIGMALTGRRKDGSEIPVEISLSPIRTAGGLLVTAGIRDVTERRRLELENRRANAYLVSAIDSVKAAFALFDEQDRVVMVNSAARALFAPVEALVGLSFAELLRRAIDAGVFDDRDDLHARWLAYHAEPAGALEVRTRDGRSLRVVDSITGERGRVSTIADVSDDVQRAEELRLARVAAEAASEAKSEFLSSMSHELRTPLNAILGFAQLLEGDRHQPLTVRQHERLHYVLRGGEHLLRLIDDILDLSRIEAGAILINSETVLVRDVLSEVISTLGPLAARTQISVAELPTTPLPRVFADRTRLQQILMNFGSNAIKYGKPGGHVTFGVDVDGDRVRIRVIDDGIGIAPEKQARVFEPFHRAGQESGPIEGTGIGLTITKRLAEMMNGGVGFTSAVDRGSEFWVEMPLDRRTTAELAPLERPRASTQPGADVPSRKLVYVEDNPSAIALMRDLLSELPHVELVTAASAELGLELVRAHHPHAVVLDITLPGMNGFEALERLKALPETREIPVIGLSAAAHVRDARRALEAGFVRYLTKPVKVAELRAALRDLLG